MKAIATGVVNPAPPGAYVSSQVICGIARVAVVGVVHEYKPKKFGSIIIPCNTAIPSAMQEKEEEEEEEDEEEEEEEVEEEEEEPSFTDLATEVVKNAAMVVKRSLTKVARNELIGVSETGNGVTEFCFRLLLMQAIMADGQLHASNEIVLFEGKDEYLVLWSKDRTKRRVLDIKYIRTGDLDLDRLVPPIPSEVITPLSKLNRLNEAAVKVDGLGPLIWEEQFRPSSDGKNQDGHWESVRTFKTKTRQHLNAVCAKIVPIRVLDSGHSPEDVEIRCQVIVGIARGVYIGKVYTPVTPSLEFATSTMSLEAT
jgi:hypothetical protein